MAVFLINICKFNGCGITFPSLGDLIQHIEDTHIDYDPKVIEQKEQAQPACLPLSYVLRFITDAARKENTFLGSSGADLKRKLAIKHHSYSMSSSNRSNTPTGSELDEDEMIVSESEDSNDSWTTEEFSSEFIMRYGSRHSGSSNGSGGNEKPFACPVPGCKKRYKNVNGIKYHSKNGHKKDGKVRKGYKCHCGKSYKTAQGLKSHALLAHNSSPAEVAAAVSNATITAAGTTILGRSTSPSQSAGSLSPSSISNMSGSSGSSNINQNQSQSLQSTHTTALNTTLSTNNLIRNNIGLISIKTNKSNLIAANVTANKILKLTTSTMQPESAIASATVVQHENNKLKFEASTATANTTKMSLPGLVNLGIITSASSASSKIQQHPFQQQNILNNSTNNYSNNNNNNHENLPLTPISPNMSTTAVTAAGASLGAMPSAAVATVTFHSNGSNDALNTDET